MSSLADALESRRIILCVGSGGVGKTTAAAALALEAARRGRRTAVLTVDPSHRLKDALGLSALSGRPSRVSLAGIGARGAHLDALLLDVKRTFDELVRALATTPEQARAVLENRLYQNLSGTLAGTAEYMAVEQVYRLAAEGGYDLLVVDTPPARHAVDFLDAPRRLANLLDSRAFAILKNPTSILPAAGSRLAQLLLAAVLRGLERFTGIGLVREVGEFVGLIEVMTGALRERAHRSSPRCRSSPPTRARSPTWPPSPATSFRARAGRPRSVCEGCYSPALSPAAPDRLRLVRGRAGPVVERRRSTFTCRLTRLPWIASSLVSRRIMSAREG